MEQCNHVYWNDRNNDNYVCEKCGDVKQDKPPHITFSDCLKCKHYPCNLDRNSIGEYNKEYRQRNKLKKHHVYMLDCRHKYVRKPGGFIDIDGTKYRSKPNQHPHVEHIPVNVKGSGGIMFFKSVGVCKCCNHTEETWEKMWEPLYDEYVKTHPNHKITLEKL